MMKRKNIFLKYKIDGVKMDEYVLLLEGYVVCTCVCVFVYNVFILILLNEFSSIVFSYPVSFLILSGLSFHDSSSRKPSLTPALYHPCPWGPSSRYHRSLCLFNKTQARRLPSSLLHPQGTWQGNRHQKMLQAGRKEEGGRKGGTTRRYRSADLCTWLSMGA